MQSTDTPADTDKQTLYGWWYKNAAWRDNLDRRMAHKALDIPDDEAMQNVGNRIGMDWKGLAVVIAGLLGAGGLTGHFLQPSPTPASPPAAVAPADSAYEVRFYDADGNPIRVPHLSERQQEP